jgi:hypothetical protein
MGVEKPVLTAEASAGVVALLAGQVFRVEQRAARLSQKGDLPSSGERYSQVAPRTRAITGGRPRSSGTRASHVLGGQGGCEFP